MIMRLVLAYYNPKRFSRAVSRFVPMVKSIHLFSQNQCDPRRPDEQKMQAMIDQMPPDGREVIQPPPPPARKSGSFASDLAKIVSGTTIAQGINVLSSPVLSRLFLPAAFGTSALFNSFTGVIGRVSSFSYDLSIMLPEDEEEAANMFGVSLILSLLTSLLLVPILWLTQDVLLTALRATELTPYIWYLPPTLFFVGCNRTLNIWNARAHQFGRLSKRNVTNVIVTVAVSLTAGFLGYTTAGSLILGVFMGMAVATTIHAIRIGREDHHVLRKIRLTGMWAGMVRYRKFPFYDSWASLLNSISWQMPTFMLTFFFNPQVVGFYALGTRVLRLPIDFLGTSISQAFFPQAAEAKSNNRLPELVESTFRRLTSFSIFPLLILMVIGEDLFRVVFGAEWGEAGVYTQYLSIWMFFWFMSAPMGVLFRVLEKQEMHLRINILIFVTRLVSLYAGGSLGSPRLAIILFSLSGVLSYGYMTLAIIHASGMEWGRIARILAKYLVLFLPLGIALAAMTAYSVSIWLRIALSVVVGLAYYYHILVSDAELSKVLSKFAWARKLGFKTHTTGEGQVQHD
jgi:lipopolysaccharide exporter